MRTDELAGQAQAKTRRHEDMGLSNDGHHQAQLDKGLCGAA
jgi:hypothetical protein